jgi:ABC-type dipeptide/oligopeptide/nickel transport system permease subunit
VSTTANVPSPRPLADGSPIRSRGYWSQALRRLTGQPVTVAALIAVVVLFAVGEAVPRLLPQGWNDIHLGPRWQNHPPTLAAGHVFGTDNIGRDVLVRTLWGLHYTEQTALVGALLATLLGVAAGALAGYYGGGVDAVLMRFADLVTGFPVIVLMIAVFVALQPVTIWEATLAFALSMWTFAARVVRARIASLAPAEFVHAARALGASDTRIFFRHLLPNAAGTLVVTATSLTGLIILIEATTEFFGFGVASLIRPTLGNLIAEATSSGIGGYSDLGLGWWVWTAPVAVLVVLLVCINLAGDGLDEALNPRKRRG